MTELPAQPLPPAAKVADRLALTQRIEALLAEAGWGTVPGSEVRREVAAPAAPGGAATRADYLLLLDGQPLAIIERWDDAQRDARHGAPDAMALALRMGLRVAFVCSADGLLFVAGQGQERVELGHLPTPEALAPMARYGTHDLVTAPSGQPALPSAPSAPSAPAASLPSAPMATPSGSLLRSAARSVGEAWRALRYVGAPKMAKPPVPMPPPADSAPRRQVPPPDSPMPVGAEPPSADAEPPVAEPVLLAASAPRQCPAGGGFTASLAAYVATAREAALQQLQQLGEAGDRVVSDLPPSGDAHWAVGAPVSVRLAGEGVDVEPAEQAFHWNGRLNTVAFDVQLRADAPAGQVALWCHVAVAGVPMAAIPLRVAIIASAAPAVPATVAEPAPVGVPAPHSVFASYASKDASDVTQRLSTLQRWAPALDIFQDCLDLRPNEAFKPQLAEQIGRRDVFLLFWSRNAAASPWVRWEYETASTAKGLQAIVPMPLEDPAIAPPPPGLADLHLRDRFLLARYGLQKIREEASQAAGG